MARLPTLVEELDGGGGVGQGRCKIAEKPFRPRTVRTMLALHILANQSQAQNVSTRERAPGGGESKTASKTDGVRQSARGAASTKMPWRQAKAPWLSPAPRPAPRPSPSPAPRPAHCQAEDEAEGQGRAATGGGAGWVSTVREEEIRWSQDGFRCGRCWLAVHAWQEVRERGATRIQSWYRGECQQLAYRRRVAQDRKQKALEATGAVRIQATFRGAVARLKYAATSFPCFDCGCREHFTQGHVEDHGMRSRAEIFAKLVYAGIRTTSYVSGPRRARVWRVARAARVAEDIH